MEGTHPLEKGCGQAALQTATASEGPWCFAGGCAPEEDAAGGSPAETCLGSASCQLPQGEDGLGTIEVVPQVFCCAVREGRNPIWIGRRREYPVWNSVMWTLILILSVCSNCVVSPPVEGSCGKMEQETSCAAWAVFLYPKFISGAFWSRKISNYDNLSSAPAYSRILKGSWAGL